MKKAEKEKLHKWQAQTRVIVKAIQFKEIIENESMNFEINLI